MSLPRYAEYKDSGVAWLGEVPGHWEVKRLKHCLSLLTEKAETSTNKMALENIESWSGSYLPTDSEFEGDGVAFAKGDILFGKLRPYLAKAYLAESSGEAVGDFHVMRPSANVAPRFAQYQILNRDFIALVDGSTFGSKMPRASWEFVGNMPFPLPATSEQTAIAAFLDRETAKIDGLIVEQEKLITLLAEKRQATISHAVTKGLNPAAPMKDSGVAWLGEVPAHWEVGGLTKFIGPVVDYRGRTPTKGDEGIFLVTAKNVRSGKIDYEISQEYVDPSEAASLLSRGAPEIGDVLFTTEAPLGQVAQIDRLGIALAQRIVKFRGLPKIMLNRFLMRWLMGNACQARLETLATGSTALGIKASKLGMIECLVPPIEEQQAIVVHLDSETTRLDELTAAATRGIALLKERRSALISAAVTGKIDVRALATQQCELSND